MAVHGKTKTEIVLGVFAVLIALISIPWWPNIFHLFSSKETPPIEQATGIKEEKSQTSIQDVKLRSLEPLETGKKISALPNGIYFYALPFETAYEIKTPAEDTVEAGNHRFKSSFEIQKIENRYYVIGYISDEMHAKLGEVSSEKPLYLQLFPVVWGPAKDAVAIPFDEIYTINDRNIDVDEDTTIGILDVGAREIIDNPTTHKL